MISSKELTIHKDAFAHGQVLSKIWLADKLEQSLPHQDPKPLNIILFAGWHGVLPFLLLSRPFFKNSKIVSYDQDSSTQKVALALNNTWECEGLFSAQVANCNTLQPQRLVNDLRSIGAHGVDLVVNTSVEHMNSDTWYNNLSLPNQPLYVIQGTNMTLDDHVSPVHSPQQLRERFPMKALLFQGSLPFFYPDQSFQRHMIIGYK